MRTPLTVTVILGATLALGAAIAPNPQPEDHGHAPHAEHGARDAARSHDGLTHPKLDPLAQFLGTWTVEAEWSWGGTVKAINTFRPGIAGKFLEQSTHVSDNDGPMYERYRTVWSYNPEEDEIVAYSFDYEGNTNILPLKVEQIDGRTRIEARWSNDGTDLHQVNQMIDDDSYAWTVRGKPSAEPDAKWQTFMEGVWHRQKDARHDHHDAHDDHDDEHGHDH